MKISKLFHWLYAILMLLPFAFFVPSILYYAFNDNSTMQTVEVPKTETVAVDFNQLVKDGDFTNNQADWGSSGFTCTIEDGYLNVDLGYSTSLAPFSVYGNTIQGVSGHKFLFKMDYFFSFSNPYITGCDFSVPNYFYGTLERDSQWHTYNHILTSADRFGRLYIQPYLIADTDFTGDVFRCTNVQIFDLTKMFGSGNEPTIEQFNTYFPNSYYPYTQSELMQITYDTGETEQLVSNTDIINYAWESIWDLPLFNWCKVSFVSVPFTYITGLFGLAASNSFNYVFTYFASMSIIWLVFDVIMYVPLLVHRWLDKGIVE